MNIILVGGRRGVSRTINLQCRRMRALVATGLGVCLTTLVALGFLVGRQFAGAPASASELEQLRSQLLTQQTQLDETEARSRRDLDALAMQLGDLQAQAARINALGQRLTRMGKIEGEFNFASTPDIGGPENLGEVPSDLISDEFAQTIGSLRSQFEAQAAQLGLLETLLTDQDLDAAFVPSGIPVRTGFVSSGFGYRFDPFTGSKVFHAGVDFDGPRGADILAVASGVVTWSGKRPGYGNVVDVDHGNGYMTRYAHNDKNLVKVGDVVEGGQLIAKMGATGRATGSHVHMEVWYQGKPINPAQFVSAIR